MPRRVLQGEVVSTKADKTAVVLVERTVTHPLYGKTMRKSKKYHAHDADNSCTVGQKVQIIETTPISKLKRFEVLNTETSAKA
ncbi:MAG: 30S ribosomal protein S17 [Alphaproteobacteria bacterium]|nr:30S ribosomal protein S17 [Alphaproteobacteria bacterium]MDD9919516.1 30S ribosomal protein S17 [Alphaproteobacteria bacterium]